MFRLRVGEVADRPTRLLRTSTLWPWVLASLAGGALALSHPPAGWWLLTFAHVPLFVYALQSREHETHRSAFAVGFVVGCAAFGPMISWLIAPAGAIGWGLLVVTQAVWMGIAAILLGRWQHSQWMPFIGAAVFTGIDAWRARVPLNGFEWGAIAYAHTDSWLLPVARVVGHRGITFLVVLSSLAGLVALQSLLANYRALRSVVLPTRSLAVLAGSLLVAALLVTDAPATSGSVDVLVAQGNDIRHWESPVDDPTLYNARALRDETLAAIGDGPLPDLVIWPESSIDRDPDSPAGRGLAPIIEEVAGSVGELIAGTTLDGPQPATQRYVAASRYVGGLNEVDRYVKRRLVPFGEYVPMRRWLDWFPPLEQVPRDAIPGSTAKMMHTESGARLAVIVCFETLFADIVRSNLRAGDQLAQIVVTVTNDASFRDTSEPAQHLAQSQLRAVETGRWVVHAAISGASAFIDPDGVIHDETEVFTRDTIRRDIPLVDGTTPYVVVGDALGWLTRIAVSVLALPVIGVRRSSWRRDGSLAPRLLRPRRPAA